MPVRIRFSPDIITSKANPLIVKTAKLEDKKHRESQGLFRFDGIKLFCEAALSGLSVEYALVRQSNRDRIVSELEGRLSELDARRELELTLLGDAAFDRLSLESSPEGIICVAKYIDNFKKTDKINAEAVKGKAIILQSVRDPGNLGTVLRCADAFGVKNVILSRDCADIFNPKTVRGAMGALFRENITVCTDICGSVEALRAGGRRVFATALHRDSLRLGDFELLPSDIFVIGNEGHGVSEDMLEACGETVYIPMCSGAESLNAGVAASVCMWELSKL